MGAEKLRRHPRRRAGHEVLHHPLLHRTRQPGPTPLNLAETRWFWLRAVSAEGNVSAFAGPVSATAL